MFTNEYGGHRLDAEALFDCLKNYSLEEQGMLSERKAILQDALNSFNMRLAALPAQEREAVTSAFLQRVIDALFEFHLSIETSVVRSKAAAAKTVEAKMATAHEFKAITDNLALLYGVRE